MNKIGFINFRRFINFEPIEYHGITFLVGRNNAGKSTLVKAILLINDFFKSGNVTNFSFGSKILEDANIVTYGRAKNRKATEDYIKFTCQVDNYNFDIVISGDDDKTIASVQSLQITDNENKIQFQLDPQETNITISKLRSIGEVENSNEGTISTLNAEIFSLKEQIEKSELKKSSKEYIVLVEEVKSIEKKRNSLRESKKAGPIYSYTTHFHKDWGLKEIVEFALIEAKFFHDKKFKEIQGGKKPTRDFENLRGIKEESSIVEDSFNIFYESVKLSGVYYLGANPAKQSALFSIRDRNNALSQSIHDFYQLKITPGELAYEFVKKWMKLYEVGDSFKILIHAGEAYEFKVASNNTEIHLADKGMGSIQAMLLILRLASIIHKTMNVSHRTTVVIEEPELNLHPALQSKLADLFLEVNQNFKLDFIIETHSEYILRRSQVIVAIKEFEVAQNENPFCVHYFPKDIQQMPYKLEYQEDGSFNRNFGDGFFDEASSSTLELLKLKRQKKA
ncbi:MAG: AAA family ATPase [Bacteroidota bacterium]